MPIVRRKKTLSSYTGEDHRKLSVILAELRARGIDPSDRVARAIIKNWQDHTSSAGYFIGEKGKIYTPTPTQEAFIKSAARFSAFFGGRGSGKTAAGAQKALNKIRAGMNGAVLNPDFENFKTSTWPEFRLWIPWDMVVPRHRYRAAPDWEPLQPFVLSFVNGVRVICKGVKDPNSARGPNINWLWYDEGARDETGLSWKIAIASVRVGGHPQAWTTTTPNGFDHFTYKFFVQKDIPEEALRLFEEAEKDLDRELVEYFFGSIEDNKQNLDPGFYASMVAAYADDPYLKKQELDGLFVQAGGTLGDRHWFDDKVLTEIPEEFVIRKRVRYWDLAATEKKVVKRRKLDPDESVGTLMAWNGSQKFIIMNQISGFWEWMELKEVILDVALADGPAVEIRIEQEPGSGGKNQVAEIKNYLKEKITEKLGYFPAYQIKEHIPSGDKIQRANIWFAEAKRGLIYLLKGDWTEKFLAQVDGFPGGRYDDKVDSVSGARMVLAPVVLWSDVPFLAV